MSFTPGPSFDALPLPGLMLDAEDRFVGVNDVGDFGQTGVLRVRAHKRANGIHGMGPFIV